MTVVDETERLARVVLRAANRTQAKGSTVRLVVPRAQEVVYELGMELGMELPQARLLEAEEFLQNHGYLVPVDIAGLTVGTYTITSRGLDWLDAGQSESSEVPRTTGGTQENAELPQQRIPRRIQLELTRARGQLEETHKTGVWSRLFGA
jgi:hypothetical protein